MYNSFNPMQARMETLLNQKQMIEQQLQSMQQMPPININNNMSPPVNFDFNGKWVDGEEQAKKTANQNLPLILFDNNNPIFYMKNMDGSFKKYRFSEIVEQQQPSTDEKINTLEGKLNAILEQLSQGNINTPTKAKKSVETTQKEVKQ